MSPAAYHIFRGILLGGLLAGVLLQGRAPAQSQPERQPSSPDAAQPLSDQQRREMAQRRSQAWDDSHRLQREGKIVEAIKAGEEALALDRQLLGSNVDQELADLLRWLAGLHAQREDFVTARKAWNAVITVETRMHGPDDWAVAEARWGLSDVDRLERMAPGDRRLYFVMRELSVQVDALQNAGKLEDALQNAQRVLSTRIRLLGRQHPDYAAALQKVSLLLARLNEFQQALKGFGEAAAIRKAALGADHPLYRESMLSVANVQNALANQAVDVTDYALAQKYNEAEIQTLVATPGVTPWQLEDARARLKSLEKLLTRSTAQLRDYRRAGDLDARSRELATQGRMKEALQTAQEACRLYAGTIGDQDSVYWQALRNLGRIQASAAPTQSEETFARALELQRKTLGQEHPGYLRSLCEELGRQVARARGQDRLDRAIALQQELIEVLDRLHGPRNGASAAAAHTMAYLQRLARLGDELRAMLREADRHELAALDLVQEGDIDKALVERRLELSKRLKVRRESASVENAVATREPDRRCDDVKIADVKEAIGTLLLDSTQWNPEQAVAAYREALELRLRNFGASHPATSKCKDMLADALAELADVMEDKRDFAGATRCAQESLEIRLSMYPPTHAKVQRLRMAIAAKQKIHALAPAQLDEFYACEALAASAQEKEQKGQLDQAIADLTQALGTRGRLVGTRHLRHANMLRRLGDMHFHCGHYEPSIAACREAADIYLSMVGEQSEPYRDMQTMMLRSLRYMTNTPNTPEGWKRLVALRQQMLDCQTRLTGEASSQAVDERMALRYAMRMAALTPDQIRRLDDSDQQRNGARRIATDRRQLPQAIEMFKQSLVTFAEILPDDLGYADCLDELGAMFRDAGNEESAGQAERQAMDLRARLLGPRHPEVLAAKMNRYYRQRDLSRARGDFAAARSACQAILLLRLQIEGRNHWRFIEDRYALEYTELLASLDEARREELLKTEADLTDSMELSLKSRTTQAIAAAEKACQVRQRIAGDRSIPYADALAQLGDRYLTAGDFGRAEPLLTDAAELMLVWYGHESPKYAAALDQMARLYAALHDTRRAAENIKEALNIRANLLQNSPSLAQEKRIADEFIEGMVLGISCMSAEIDKVDEIAPVLPLLRTMAQAMVQRDTGPRTASEIALLSLVGQLSMTAGDLAAAEKYFIQARDASERLFGRENSQYASCVQDIGWLEERRGNRAAAAQAYQQSLRILRAQYGPDAMETIGSCMALARILQLDGDHDGAMALAQQVMKIDQQHLRRFFAAAAEPAMAGYMDNLMPALEFVVNLAAANGRSEGPGVDAALLWTLRRKTAALTALFHTRGAVALEARDPTVATRVERLRDLRRRLALLASDPPRGTSPDELRRLARSLRDEANRLESELGVIASARHPEPPPDPTLADVRAALPHGGLLLEFFKARTTDFKLQGRKSSWLAPHYFAFVLSRDPAAPARMFDLGDAKAIDQAAAAVHAALKEFDPRLSDEKEKEAVFLAASTALYELLFVKSGLIDAIGEARTICVAPDGDLHLVSFEALAQPVNTSGSSGARQSVYLIEKGFRFAYLSSGQDLLRPRVRSGEGAVVIAAPDFGAAPAERELLAQKLLREQAASQFAMRGVHLAGLRGGTFAPLPGTLLESESVEKALAASAYGPVRAYRGKEALRPVFLAMRAPRVLHVATHGFFLPDPQEASAHPGGAPGRSDRGGIVLARNPLLRSGLALAGANLGGVAGADDGLITAEEICLMDLRGTELVVLSACESGLGQVRCGQGVYGLRWAFLNAGARSLITSLCRVDDSATQQWMEKFYGALTAGKDKLESLHATQLAILQQRRAAGGAAHPFFWASFILVGDAH